jgi:hypothetical protein
MGILIMHNVYRVTLLGGLVILTIGVAIDSDWIINLGLVLNTFSFGGVGITRLIYPLSYSWLRDIDNLHLPKSRRGEIWYVISVRFLGIIEMGISLCLFYLVVTGQFVRG